MPLFIFLWDKFILYCHNGHTLILYKDIPWEDILTEFHLAAAVLFHSYKLISLSSGPRVFLVDP